MDERQIVFWAFQRNRGQKEMESYVLLTPAEAERLENALRLARTGKLGKERPVRLSQRAQGGVSTRIVVKGYVPNGEA